MFKECKYKDFQKKIENPQTNFKPLYTMAKWSLSQECKAGSTSENPCGKCAAIKDNPHDELNRCRKGAWHNSILRDRDNSLGAGGIVFEPYRAPAKAYSNCRYQPERRWLLSLSWDPLEKEKEKDVFSYHFYPHCNGGVVHLRKRKKSKRPSFERNK